MTGNLERPLWTGAVGQSILEGKRFLSIAAAGCKRDFSGACSANSMLSQEPPPTSSQRMMYWRFYVDALKLLAYRIAVCQTGISRFLLQLAEILPGFQKHIIPAPVQFRVSVSSMSPQP